MSDYLVKALAFDGQVRAYGACTTETVNEAQRRHGTLRTASAALGRAMTAGVIMGAMQKGDIKTTIKVEGHGPIGIILVDSNADGEVRGYVSNPKIHFELNEVGKLDVRRAVGTEGTLTVVKDLGLKENFSGQVPIVSGELAEDFTYYFAASEQTPSTVALGVLTSTADDSIIAAGGFIVQLMPGTTDEVIDEIEKAVKDFPQVSKLIEQGLTVEEILQQLLGKENVTILEKMPVQFKCQCSKERMASALIGLGEKELKEMIEEDGQAETQCHFCNEFYLFNKEELESLLAESKG